MDTCHSRVAFATKNIFSVISKHWLYFLLQNLYHTDIDLEKSKFLDLQLLDWGVHCTLCITPLLWYESHCKSIDFADCMYEWMISLAKRIALLQCQCVSKSSFCTILCILWSPPTYIVYLVHRGLALLSQN